jgi:hypothetical protein
MAYYDKSKTQYAEQGNVNIINRLLVSWYKFDDYYIFTDDAPVYVITFLLYPSFREHFLRNH